MTKIIFSKQAKETFEFLKKGSCTSKKQKTLYEAIKTKIQFLEENIHYGSPITKKLIPAEYKVKYEITNLFRIELPQFWRMLYTLTNSDSEKETKIEIIAFIIDITNHKDYNKIFGYKNK